jgi:hypothetical protein
MGFPAHVTTLGTVASFKRPLVNTEFDTRTPTT